MLFGHHNYTGTPSAATQFWAVFFPFIGLDFKPKCYDLVFSMVNTIRADVLTQLSSITAVTNSWQPSHGCPPSPKLPRCWLVVLWAVVRVGESVPSHTPSRVCAWTTQGNFCIHCFLFFFIFPIAGSRSKQFTQTASPSMTTPARPSLPPSPSSASMCWPAGSSTSRIGQTRSTVGWADQGVQQDHQKLEKPPSLWAHLTTSCCVVYVWPILVVEDPTCQHILAEDGDGGRDGLAGVVVEGYVVGVDCLILEPAIGKIKKNTKQYIQQIT